VLCQKNEGDVRLGAVYPLPQLDTVWPLAKVDVYDGCVCIDSVQALFGVNDVGTVVDLEVCTLQGLGDESPDEGVVFDDEYASLPLHGINVVAVRISGFKIFGYPKKGAILDVIQAVKRECFLVDVTPARALFAHAP
jgi:hypothetical protein